MRASQSRDVVQLLVFLVTTASGNGTAPLPPGDLAHARSTIKMARQARPDMKLTSHVGPRLTLGRAQLLAKPVGLGTT
jgi:hypothetical protein